MYIAYTKRIGLKKAPKTLFTTKDSQENTIAHVVAASENTEVFKVLCFATMIKVEHSLISTTV